jgi:hypothetical protein
MITLSLWFYIFEAASILVRGRGVDITVERLV